MLNIPVRLSRITVIFNPQNLSSPLSLISDDFQIDTILNRHQLRIPQGIALIVCDLLMLPGFEGQPAAFANPPLTWFNPDDPSQEITQPEVFLVQSFWPNHLNIVDFNTVKQENEHPVNINVVYNGVTYSSDPVIVNEPPAQPGQG